MTTLTKPQPNIKQIAFQKLLNELIEGGYTLRDDETQAVLWDFISNNVQSEGKITEIIDGVFLHGKETPDKSYDLPKGQYTVAEAINLIINPS